MKTQKYGEALEMCIDLIAQGRRPKLQKINGVWVVFEIEERKNKNEK